MKCFACDREIKENEKIYVNESEIYCSDCIREETLTQYILNGEVLLGQDDEVQVYGDKNEAITECNSRLEYLTKQLNKAKSKGEKNLYGSELLIEAEEDLLKNLLDNE